MKNSQKKYYQKIKEQVDNLWEHLKNKVANKEDEKEYKYRTPIEKEWE